MRVHPAHWLYVGAIFLVLTKVHFRVDLFSALLSNLPIYYSEAFYLRPHSAPSELGLHELLLGVMFSDQTVDYTPSNPIRQEQSACFKSSSLARSPIIMTS